MGCLVTEHTQEQKAKPAQLKTEPARRNQPDSALALRSFIGNQAFGACIQASLRVSSSGDAHEREADRIAQQFVAGQPVGRIERFVAPALPLTPFAASAENRENGPRDRNDQTGCSRLTSLDGGAALGRLRQGPLSLCGPIGDLWLELQACVFGALSGGGIVLYC